MNVFIYAMLWLSFGIGHSILAKISVQEKLRPLSGKYYRLLYNLFAVLHMVMVLAAGAWLLSTGLFSIFAPINLLMMIFQLVGVVVIFIAMKQYDAGEFSGLSQLRGTQSVVESQGQLNTGGFNRWVRHPLYAGAFMFLWAGATSEFGFFTALFGSAYLWIGSNHEEKKLVTIFGEDYRAYQKSVPAFFPSPSRFKNTTKK